MHAANFKALSLDAVYGKFDVEPRDFARFVREKAAEGYRGLNVTIPHKIAAAELLDRADETVAVCGACNTLRFDPDGKISGFNTDVAGFLECLSSRGFDLKGRVVFVAGCGGAGSAIAAAAAHALAAKTILAARRPEQAETLAAKIASSAARPSVETACARPGATPEETAAAWAAAAARADLVVNATPLGLKEGDPSALPASAFRKGQLVLDIIPTKRFPPTAALAREMGAEAMDGLEFLARQGAKSFEIWTGVAADFAAMLRAAREG